MKRAFLLVLCCCALGAGCAEKSNAPAATADGITVTTKDVADELDAITANSDYLKNIDNGFKQQGQAVVGSAPGTYDAGFVAQVLTRQLQFALTHSEVERRQLEVSDDCKLAATNDLNRTLGQGDVQQGQATLAAFPEAYRNRLEGWYADQWALQSDLVHQPCGGQEVAKAYFDAHPEEFVQMCVSLISAGDQNTANSVVAQARAGGDFASLARQFSTDAQTASSGGDAGCHSVNEISPAFAATLQAAPTGAVTDPVATGNGSYVVFKVNDRKPAMFADVSAQAEQLAARDQAVEFRGWLQRAVEDAHITVDPRFGTFDPSTGSIQPPPVDNASNASNASSSSSEAPPASTP